MKRSSAKYFSIGILSFSMTAANSISYLVEYSVIFLDKWGCNIWNTELIDEREYFYKKILNFKI